MSDDSAKEPYQYTTIEYPPRLLRRAERADVDVQWVDGHGVKRVTGVTIDVGR